MKTRAGFTLIELSIVLVIIGLIIGGVLAGKTLIHAAEIRKTVSQIQQTQTAINTFENKYNCLPGDCTNASNFFSGAVNGNGDGQIAYNPATDNGDEAPLEPYNVWSHLSAAGLIAGSFSPFSADDYDGDNDTYNQALPAANPQILAPSAALAGSFLTVSYNPGYTGSPYITPGNYIALSAIPYGDFFTLGAFVALQNMYSLYLAVPPVPTGIYPQDAFAIDTKMDDGLPLTGSVSVMAIAGGAMGCTTANGHNTYDMSTAANIQDCMLLIPLGIQ